MAITVYPDRIQFNKYSLSIDDNGLKVSGNGIFSSTVLRTGLGGFGTVSGYTSGGRNPSVNIIDKFPFATNANATDVGDLYVAREYCAGQSSAVSGYTSGGTNTYTTDKFSFATNSNGSFVGNLSQNRRILTGQSSTISGYNSGGSYFTPPSTTTVYNTIDKFPFATDTNSTNVGTLTRGRYGPAGQSSTTHGYTAGGIEFTPTPIYSNVIDRFPFAVNANASDVGDLTPTGGRTYLGGQSSDISGYTSGGQPGGSVIDKFPFATNTNATNVGTLTVSRSGTAGQSSSTSGYNTGGQSTINVIDKFPFATDSNASDVGDLTVGRYAAAGQQY